MSAVRLDGKLAAADIKAELAGRVAALRARGVTPGLGTVIVGDDPASKLYVAGKHRDCAEVGIESIQVELPAAASFAEVAAALDDLNANPACTGYIVQLPLPEGLDQDALLARIDPAKDADGLHPANLGALLLNVRGELVTPQPCTPRGCVELLRRGGVPLDGAHVVVLGRGVTVGRPIGPLLTRRDLNATVTLTHTGTRGLPELVRQADVVVAAVGQPHFVQPDWVRPGAAVLDVGVTRVTDPQTGRARVRGDVHPDVAEVAGYLSPNPGGVGPMTRAMLLVNVVEAAERAAA